MRRGLRRIGQPFKTGYILAAFANLTLGPDRFLFLDRRGRFNFRLDFSGFNFRLNFRFRLDFRLRQCFFFRYLRFRFDFRFISS